MNHVLLLVIMWMVVLTRGNEESPSSTQVLAANCSKKCGNVDIWYPFGIEDGCYFKEDGVDVYEYFKINCSHSSYPPRPINWNGAEVLSIAVNPSEFRIKQLIAYNCHSSSIPARTRDGTDIRSGQFTFSSTKNIFVVMGCDSSAWFSGTQRKPWRSYMGGCMTQCTDLKDVIDGDCNGGGCCQIPQPPGLFSLDIRPSSFNNHTEVMNFNPCTTAFIVEKEAFNFNRNNLSRNYYMETHESWVPVVVDWSIFKEDCTTAKDQGRCLCKSNTVCLEPRDFKGYICRCKQGFHGNPYHPQGCIDFDECKSGKHKCEKPEYCVNDIGDHHCQCPKGYSGKGTKNDRCISNKKKWLLPVVIIAAGGGGGIILLLGVTSIVYIKRAKRKLNKMQESFFRQNGGLLLSQKLSSHDIGLKVFTAQDLVNATNNYNDKYIIGKGGFGIVYKGTLPDDQHIAIKRSLKVDPGQIEQFINEIIVLSKINNRNVVKLLGCCLETEVPLLVYEFITNGTLFDHLNDVVKASILTWSTRLQIATEVASVLSYLHNTISPPIIHRDMKSMNILLDENYIAKVADFGASRMVPIDQGQLATIIQGTWGYLDPEYLLTSELTEKSDVYSFGVVLVELLTRKRAISNDRPEPERCLAMHFIIKMTEGSVFNILDKNIIGEGTIEQIQLVADLAKHCLMVKGENRPSMKEVAMELETIKRKGLHPSTEEDESFQNDVNASLQGGYQRSESTGGTSNGVDSDLYDPRLFSTSRDGR